MNICALQVTAWQITVSKKKDHVTRRHLEALSLWMKTYMLRGMFGIEYGREEKNRHGHIAGQLRWPNGAKGGRVADASREPQSGRRGCDDPINGRAARPVVGPGGYGASCLPAAALQASRTPHCAGRA